MKEKLTALFKAAKQGDLITLSQHLDPGTINQVNRNNETPLIVAVVAGQKKIVEQLLQRPDIDLHIQGFITGTALTYAIFSQQYDIADLLLNKEEQFINTQHPGALNWTLLHENLDFTNKLVAKGANINTPGLEGFPTPSSAFDNAWKLYDSELNNTPFPRENQIILRYTPLELAHCLKKPQLTTEITRLGALPNSPGKKRIPKPEAKSSPQKNLFFEQLTGSSKGAATFLGIYEIASQQFQTIAPELKSILKNILRENQLTADQLAQVAQHLQLPKSHFSSLYILYCGLNPEKSQQQTSSFELINRHLESIIDKSSVHHLQDEVQCLCNVLLGPKIELTAPELKIKNSVLNKIETRDWQTDPADPADLTTRYIETFYEEIDNASDFASSANIASDSRMLLSDHQWANIAPLLISSNRDAFDLRSIAGAIVFQNKTGESWTIMPHEIDPGKVYYYYKLWQDQKILGAIIEAANQNTLSQAQYTSFK
jgi:ankyrin repeat protein